MKKLLEIHEDHSFLGVMTEILAKKEEEEDCSCKKGKNIWGRRKWVKSHSLDSPQLIWASFP